MSRWKSLLVIAIGIATAHNSLAQKHYNAWLRGTISTPVATQIKIDNEGQYRRQNGLENSYFPGKHLMFSYRSWVHYQRNKELKYSVSPFAYFSNYRIIKGKGDDTIEPTPEVRFTAAVEWQPGIRKQLALASRSAIEYRALGSGHTDIVRLRSRLGLRYSLSRKLEADFFEELLFNFPGTNACCFWDQGRVGVDLGCRVLPDLKCNLGYMHITRSPMVSKDIFYEQNIYLNLTYKLAH
ncbi:MAG: DUF2490 domain-containing protein [Taibaiella sp.]|nr:DUF2490 domain-containing protein [Taibaiella sp.]